MKNKKIYRNKQYTHTCFNLERLLSKKYCSWSRSCWKN